MLSPLLKMSKEIVTTVSMMPWKVTKIVAEETFNAIIKAGKKACKIF